MIFFVLHTKHFVRTNFRCSHRQHRPENNWIPIYLSQNATKYAWKTITYTQHSCVCQCNASGAHQLNEIETFWSIDRVFGWMIVVFAIEYYLLSFKVISTFFRQKCHCFDFVSFFSIGTSELNTAILILTNSTIAWCSTMAEIEIKKNISIYSYNVENFYFMCINMSSRIYLWKILFSKIHLFWSWTFSIANEW